MSSPSRPLAALRFFFLVVCVLETNFLRSRPAEVLATEPVATTGQAAELIWNFDADGPPAQGVVTEAVGQLRIAECGPTGDLFIGLPPRNRALRLEAAGAHLRIPDDTLHGPLDFEQGDSLTLEAWVRTEPIANGRNVYVIGKGRTYETSKIENHNYALRLTANGGTAKVSFLFSTSPVSTSPADAQPEYHRWTSQAGFVPDGLWHHIAVSYRFGDPDTIQGFVDGKPTGGKWDMGGATELPPVTDNDAVWIGSSRGGDPANSLVGELDDIRIHRRLVSAKEMASRRVVEPYTPTWPATADPSRVTVTLHESAGSHTDFPLILPEESFRFSIPVLAIHRLPLKYLPGGTRDTWKGPVLMRAFARVGLPAGEIQLLTRSPGRTRLWIDGHVVATTPPRRLFPDAHQPFIVYQPDIPWLRVPHVGDHEQRENYSSKGGIHEVVLETLVGSSSSRCELGETMVAMRQGDAMFTLLEPPRTSSHAGEHLNVPQESADTNGSADSAQPGPVHLVDQEFLDYRDRLEQHLHSIDRQLLVVESSKEESFWEMRHQLARHVISSWAPVALPPRVPTLHENNAIDRLVHATLSDPSDAEWDLESIDRLTADLQFLRRLSLDTVGVPPTLPEIEGFLAQPADRRRELAIERLVADVRWADHWTSYWQDVLAENPNILKPSLNNTGPFRWWIHDALLINKPMDRFVTELIRMEGSPYAGAAAGFEMATENDVPMAEKAHVVASAFLSVDMKCARCHDAPYHPWSQKDLFSLGAMLGKRAIKVPETSSVPRAFFDRKGDDSPISVTLQPGDVVEPQWPTSIFDREEFGEATVDPRLLGRAEDSREVLAAMVTRADNRRFSKTLANRLWTRLMGWGLVNDTDDWFESTERNRPLLEYLSRELVESGYDFRKLAKLIFESRTYQRQALDPSQVTGQLAYAAPWRRRLSAEQVVDSLHRVAGVEMETEPITFDPEASQKIQNFLNLGTASRAWQLTSLSNERDRPSLSLPKAATIVECLEAFGWRASRQSPATHREYEANMVQPGIVANGHLTGRVTRLSDQSRMTERAIAADSVQDFIDAMFMSVLTRQPSDEERVAFAAQLSEGFGTRVRVPEATERMPPVSRGFATWSNHFAVEANALMREIEREVAAGPPPSERLSPEWRERAEDALWALVNAPEFQFIP